MEVGSGIEAGPISKGREGIFLTILSNAPRSYPLGEFVPEVAGKCLFVYLIVQF